MVHALILCYYSKPERELSGCVVSRQLTVVENEFRLHKAMQGDLSSCFQNIINTCIYQICHRLSGVLYASPGGGVLPHISHIGSRYVRPKRVWFCSRFGLK